jgi:hypothetical protein|tara:strand:- start:509 stop:1945 length:1437 start_codon:yes stop_codon:yes gene_type:complete
MLKPKIIENQKFSKIKLVEVLFYTFPLWFIVGNLAVSTNTLLFIIVSLILIKKEQLTFRFNNLNWLLIIFFSYLFISTTIHYLNPGILNDRLEHLSLENNPIIKSFLLVRFLILIIVLDTLFFNKILSFKKLFLSSLICTSFVSFDVILQYLTGSDLFGFKTLYTWNSGPFGNERITTTFLKNFSFFSFFYIFETYKDKNFSKILFIFTITLHLLAALLAGNRMPMILFLFGCLMIIFFIKNLRIIMSLSLIIFASFFFLIIKNDKNFGHTYEVFFSDINIAKLIANNKNVDTKSKKNIEGKIIENDVKEKDAALKPSAVPRSVILLRHSGYYRVYFTSIAMWKERPLTGFGLKSLRFKCWDMLSKHNVRRQITKEEQIIVCANHAHNYYLELLSETGIIGVSLMIIFFLSLLKDIFYYLKRNNQQINLEVNLLTPIIILFLLEIWPIKSTGSFFTTWGATFFWLNIGLLISGLSRKT